MTLQQKVFGILRICMGWLFLWAFLDKLFGFGFATSADKAWIAGGSPTYGFLKHGTQGPFADLFQSLAGNPFIDWIYMISLLLMGVSLLLGISIRPACYGGMVFMFLLWLATLLPKNNPILDEHLIYILVLFLLVLYRADQYYGFGKRFTEIFVREKQ